MHDEDLDEMLDRRVRLIKDLRDRIYMKKQDVFVSRMIYIRMLPIAVICIILSYLMITKLGIKGNVYVNTSLTSIVVIFVVYFIFYGIFGKYLTKEADIKIKELLKDEEYLLKYATDGEKERLAMIDEKLGDKVIRETPIDEDEFMV